MPKSTTVPDRPGKWWLKETYGWNVASVTYSLGTRGVPREQRPLVFSTAGVYDTFGIYEVSSQPAEDWGGPVLTPDGVPVGDQPGHEEDC
jgi:hypothetical protein